MAISKRGILGGLSGSVASVTGFCRNSKNIIVSRNLRKNIIPSSAMLDVRSTFKYLTTFAKGIFLPTLRYYIIQPNNSLSSWNWFCKYGFSSFTPYGLNKNNNLQISSGSLNDPLLIRVTWHVLPQWIQFTWAIPAKPFDPSNNDFANVVLYNVMQNDFVVLTGIAVRSDGTYQYYYPGYWHYNDVVVNFLYFTSTIDGFNASCTENIHITLL